MCDPGTGTGWQYAPPWPPLMPSPALLLPTPPARTLPNASVGGLSWCDA